LETLTMAGETKNCPYCGEEILADAVKCKYCREFLHGLSRVQIPAKKIRHKKSGVTATVLCAVVLLIIGYAAINGTESPPPVRTASANQTAASAAESSYPVMRRETDAGITAKELAWIGRQKDNIKGRLSDPESAKFQNVLISRATGAPVVLGEVNSKNGFGGYTGFRRFMVAEHIQFIEGVDVTYDEFNKTWNIMVP
jgi:hypothetical protein